MELSIFYLRALRPVSLCKLTDRGAESIDNVCFFRLSFDFCRVKLLSSSTCDIQRVSDDGETTHGKTAFNDECSTRSYSEDLVCTPCKQ